MDPNSPFTRVPGPPERGIEFLTEDETVAAAAQLIGLLEHPGWATFCEVVKSARLAARENALEDERGPQAFLYWKGYVHGLQKLDELPLVIIRAAEGIQQREDVPEGEKLLEFRQPREDSGDVSFD